MVGKIVKLISEIIFFAGILWRFSDAWQINQIQYLDATTIVLQVIIIMLSAAVLTSAVVQLIREIRQRRREREENRVGPDL